MWSRSEWLQLCYQLVDSISEWGRDGCDRVHGPSSTLYIHMSIRMLSQTRLDKVSPPKHKLLSSRSSGGVQVHRRLGPTNEVRSFALPYLTKISPLSLPADAPAEQGQKRITVDTRVQSKVRMSILRNHQRNQGTGELHVIPRDACGSKPRSSAESSDG